MSSGLVASVVENQGLEDSCDVFVGGQVPTIELESEKSQDEDSCDVLVPGLAAVPSFPIWGKLQPGSGDSVAAEKKEAADAMAHGRLASARAGHRQSQKQQKQQKQYCARKAVAAAKSHVKEEQLGKFKDYELEQPLHDEDPLLEAAESEDSDFIEEQYHAAYAALVAAVPVGQRYLLKGLNYEPATRAGGDREGTHTGP